MKKGGNKGRFFKDVLSDANSAGNTYAGICAGVLDNRHSYRDLSKTVFID
jgi:hypothetical protein